MAGLVVGLGLGFFIGAQARARTASSGATEAIPSAELQGVGPLATEVAPPAGNTDKFGRAPGDQHFGHDHPPDPGAAPPNAPPATDGGPDSFGRAAGSEHYGHNHP